MLVHRLNNATQLISGVNSLVAIEGAEALLAARWQDLHSVSTEAHALGWVLAVLASAAGNDMLLERREPTGLEPMLQLVDHALRREGRRLGECDGPLPRLAPHFGHGWEIPWAIASTIFAGHAALPVTESALEGGGPHFGFRLGEGHDQLELATGSDAGASGALADCRERILERLPAAALEPGSDGWTLLLPKGGLEPAREAAR